MNFTPEELALIVEGLDKKLWSLDHVGMSDSHPRKVAFRQLRSKIVDSLKAGIR